MLHIVKEKAILLRRRLIANSYGFGKANPTTDGHKSSIRKYVQYLSQTFYHICDDIWFGQSFCWSFFWVKEVKQENCLCRLKVLVKVICPFSPMYFLLLPMSNTASRAFFFAFQNKMIQLVLRRLEMQSDIPIQIKPPRSN